ncbi:MAG: GNAT family N-acetyltransferase [Candidatus Aminicenantia bacterium]
MRSNEIETQIMEVLKKSRTGMQIEEIADKLDLTRHTVAKYLEVLKAKRQIHFHKVGRTKLWKEISANVIVKLLTMDDIPDILAIEERIEKYSGIDERERMEYLKQTIQYHIEKGEPIMNLGAEIDGRLVGFIIGEIRLWEFGRGERTGWIKVLGVDPEYQGRGIGKKMGEKLMEYFKREGIQKVRTLVDWYEGDLISYFKSLGFDILNMIPLEKEL